MAKGTKIVNVAVTVNPQGTLDFHLGGDVNANKAVEVRHGDTDTIKWQLNGRGVTFADAPILWVISCSGKASDPWLGSEPPVTRDNDTSASADVDNTADHRNTLTHCYTINVMYGGVIYPYDPEVDEQGSGGIL